MTMFYYNASISIILHGAHFSYCTECITGLPRTFTVGLGLLVEPEACSLINRYQEAINKQQDVNSFLWHDTVIQSSLKEKQFLNFHFKPFWLNFLLQKDYATETVMKTICSSGSKTHLYSTVSLSFLFPYESHTLKLIFSSIWKSKFVSVMIITLNYSKIGKGGRKLAFTELQAPARYFYHHPY